MYHDDWPNLIQGDLFYTVEVRKCNRVHCPHRCRETNGPGDWDLEDQETRERVHEGLVKKVGEILKVGKVVGLWDITPSDFEHS